MGRHKKVMLKVCYREMRSDVLARHMKQHSKRNETNPVTNIYVKMSNISFSPEYNKVVIKKWKRMVLDGDIKEVQYSTPRKCKKCSLSFVDAIDMFKHIKDIHIHNQSSTVKEKKAFQLLPLEILDLLISFLKPEDILMLRDCLPRVQHCPRFKRLVNKTSWFNIALKLWDMGCMKVVDTS